MKNNPGSQSDDPQTNNTEANNAQTNNPMQAPLAGLQLIEASAGTGKTYTISGLFLRLLLEAELPVEKILVVTFTKAATEELRDRIRQRVVDALLVFNGMSTDDELLRGLLERSENRLADLDRLRVAVFSFDQVPILTIHSFSQRVLQDHAFGAAVPFACDLLEDESELRQQVVDDFWRVLVPQLPAPVLEYVLSKGGPTALANNIRGWAERPGLVVSDTLRPEAGSDNDGYSRWLAAVEAFRGSWQSDDGIAAREYLLNNPELSRVKVRVATISPVIQGMEQLLEAGDGPLPEKFSYLGAEYLSADKVMKKGKTLKPFALYAAVDVLLHAEEQRNDWLLAWERAVRVELLNTLWAELPKLKQARRVRGYSDFLSELNGALKSDDADALIANVRRKFGAALIDEFQDTDELQFDNFSRLFVQPLNSGDVSGPDAAVSNSEAAMVAANDSMPVFLVGDPKQAIYSFRGADIYAYLSARKVADNGYNLDTNWRSSPALVDATNALFQRQEQPFVIEEIGYTPVRAAEKERPELVLPEDLAGAALTLNWLPADDKPRSANNAVQYSLQHCADTIAAILTAAADGKALIGERAICGGDIAVLVRSNYQGGELQAALRERGVNSIRTDQANVWQSAEADSVLRLLLALAEPQRADIVRAALASPLFACTSSDLLGLANDELAWDEWLQKLRRWRQLWQEHGLARCWQELSAEQGISARLLAQPSGARKLTNANHVIELLAAESQRQTLDAVTLLQWLQQQMAASGEQGAAESALLRLDSDDNLVKIITVHKSKGLEYPLVFCPTFFADVRDPGGDWICWHDDEHQARLGFASVEGESVLAGWRREQLAEDMRLLYVAMTRAVFRCWLYWGDVKTSRSSNAMAWLLHESDETVGRADELLAFASSLADEAANDAGSSFSVELLNDNTDEIVCLSAETNGTDIANLTAKTASRNIRQNWRMTSFTGIAYALERNAQFRAQNDVADGADYDQHEPPKPLIIEDSIEPEGIHAFPRGARAGRCLHWILEQLNFANDAEQQVAEKVQKGLQRYGYDGELWSENLTQSIQDILATPLTGAGCSLSDLPVGSWLPEMEFHYPLSGLGGAELMALLHKHNFGAGTAIEARLKGRSFPKIDGYMKGFIDLIYEAGGKYYVADYKSNWLGNDASAYTVGAVTEAIAEADYYLQYLIYTIALHRYLKTRIADYRYETHMGGVQYLFLRGMAGTGSAQRAEESQNGSVYFHRPAEALVKGLDALMG